MTIHDRGLRSLALASGIPAEQATTSVEWDLLSQVFASIRLRGEFIYRLPLFPELEQGFAAGHSYFHYVQSGAVRVIDAQGGVIDAGPGDLLLSLHAAGHRMVVGDSPAVIICGAFRFEGAPLPLIMAAMPAFIHLPASAGPVPLWLASIVSFMVEEAALGESGAGLMISRLIDLLVLRTLRTWVDASEQLGGWLAGLKDPRIGRALQAIHDEPFRSWSVEALANIAMMSRSAFALRFNATVGIPPLRYSTQWRLTLAADLLRTMPGLRVVQVASRVGYESEASFSRAFKSHFGCSPSAARGI
jgi:AraC-like DNA-binding protein